jgi:hypothetical protein
MTQRHQSPKRPARVAEPVQVYLQPPDRERLERLTARLGTTKSDILRRGLEALEAQTTTRSTAADGGRVPLPTFTGGVLAPGVDLDDSAALLDLMDEEAPPATD